MQPQAHARVDGNGGPSRTLLEALGSEDAVVQAFIDAFDATEIDGGVVMAGRLLTALLDELAADPVALERLRQLVGDAKGEGTSSLLPVYTVASLARELGRSERSIRGAIARGELHAVKRGRGYVISADAVASWATAPKYRTRSESARTPRRPRPGTGPMRRALS